MSVLLEKVKEVLFSVLPITLIVLILHFTLTPLSIPLLLRFILGALFIILGLSIFLFGVDIGISPLGDHIGTVISKSNKVWVIIVIGFILGFFISIAEPDLQILAAQVKDVTSGQIHNIAILLVVSVGIGALLVAGLIHIVYNVPLNKLLTILYGIILVLSFFVSPEFLAIGFDASGATTGALTVPFILALALGISVLKRDSKASENDSFGLVAITSTGAIIGVLLMGILTRVEGLSSVLSQSSADTELVWPVFAEKLPKIALESLMALLPLIIIFILFQIFAFKLTKKPFKKMLKGFLYTLLGLIIFLTGVNAGFMDVGKEIGAKIAEFDNKGYAIVVAFIIGFVTILAEPAVHVLTDQIETVTSGYIKRKLVLAALSIGVGLAVALSIIRIVVPDIQLWHYLLPGYIISITMSYFVPKLYVGIAFDSGGVASGPMTATFILAFTQGVANTIPDADVLKDAFGMIALVAMTPIITLQTLGLIVKIKARKRTVKENA